MSYQDVSKLPRWFKYTKDYTWFSAASSTVSAALVTLPSGGVVNAAFAKVTTTFSGGSVATANITVDAQGTGDIIPSMDIMSLSSDTLDVPHYGNIGGTTVIGATVIVTGDTCDNLSQGSIDIYLLISNLT